MQKMIADRLAATPPRRRVVLGTFAIVLVIAVAVPGILLLGVLVEQLMQSLWPSAVVIP
jgi:hypothetical protein